MSDVPLCTFLPGGLDSSVLTAPNEAVAECLTTAANARDFPGQADIDSSLLWVYHAPRDDVRCLCKRCLDEYRDSNEYIITRRDPFQKEEEPCDRCRHLGYDYILKHRRKN